MPKEKTFSANKGLGHSVGELMPAVAAQKKTGKAAAPLKGTAYPLAGTFISKDKLLKKPKRPQKPNIPTQKEASDPFEKRMLATMRRLEKKLAQAEGKSATGGLSDAGVEARRQAARVVARIEVSDAVTAALNNYGGSLRELHRTSGIDPAFVSRLANGEHNKQGATVASLARIADALGMTLTITIQ
ncbi:MAG: hypothetical protein JKY25_00690 [Robiginitomaculum sp.]|nr:hypothetical protein [Robiginitomaculum sp.]